MTNNVLMKELLTKVMRGEWDEVVKIHQQDRRAYNTKITSSGHTALHLAISQVEKETVEKLVDLLINQTDENVNTTDGDVVSEAKEMLRVENEEGRTPLHVAAATGSMTLCRCIVRVDKSLVLVRDKKGETPLFRAVRYGRKRAFLYLHSMVFGRDDHAAGDTKHCCRDDGQTILHTAIIRENFDLAFQIIYLYKELVNYADKEGELPLHALARKPSAFRSGINLRGREKIIYNCMSVKEIEVDNKALEKYSDLEYRLKDNNSNPVKNKRCTFLNSIRFLLCNLTHIGHVKKACENVDIETGREERTHQTDNANQERQPYFWAGNISRCFEYSVKFVCEAILRMVFGYGHTSTTKIRSAKMKHAEAIQVLNELLKHSTMYDNDDLETCQMRSKVKTKKNSDDDSRDSDYSDEDNVSESSNISEQPSCTNISDATGKQECSRREANKNMTPILLAAGHGVTEIVEKILKRFPVAIYDKDKDSKSVLLMAVQKRNFQLYQILINRYHRKDYVLQKLDNKANTALHYAAMYDENTKPWPVPGAALQMQWEIKWHEYVENTMPPSLYLRTNMEGRTPNELFSDTHKDLVKAGSKWLTNTGTSCSVVATLIATVAFACSITAPGGTDSKSGKPRLERSFTFELFAVASLIALCFSVTSLIMFLAILTSRHQEKDFGKVLPRKILWGLTSLFVSIASMLVTFCAGHFLLFEDNFRYASLPVYAVTLLPLCLFAAAQFPLYFDLLMATFWSPFRIATSRLLG